MPLVAASKNKSVIGLDIEAGSVAATEVRSNRHVEVLRHGIVPLPPGVFREGDVVDPEALGAAIKELFATNKLGRTVRVGIANQRVAVRLMQLPAIDDPKELETAIRFQAQDHIPMPLDQAVLDWQVIGHSQSATGEHRVDVVVVAARRDMLEQIMRALGKAGVRPIGIDHSAFGLVRALAHESGDAVGHGEFISAPSYEQRLRRDSEPEVEADPNALAMTPARLYCNLADVTNLAVARGTSCLFTRIASFGIEGIAQKLAERRQLTLEHARQWLTHVGLEQPRDQIEGDPEHVSAARECLAEGAAKLADELRLSLEYYGAQENAVAVEGIVACGPGASIPGLIDRLQRDLGHPFTVARPAALGHLDEMTAARLTLSYGLALEQ
jgi:type IV pilus assembly protein PilM